MAANPFARLIEGIIFLGLLGLVLMGLFWTISEVVYWIQDEWSFWKLGITRRRDRREMQERKS